ncbi:MAG: hypothetical protein CLLPBCKN_007376 [Chroococcidiopsis cubana SAG 39.79]|uniref:Membrane protein n=1 Tax=Chroococcidiopsis cubana SAG 39.79 TaxID=388085 RepID=A0AB37UDB8_9CYAN|nr:YkvA family protein [Chroococcidiopsis cubana]MDZ4877941.1 hypothetical protein [Chroococcidiopsis cubana SAG 39.79]PSB66371.1 hypothetical protein C7B79_01580 [Chroococcidiopsis cubana CCALA 043]RUT06930.1 membrane protein [Chroococcidiopsis cubana SAG 39.79]
MTRLDKLKQQAKHLKAELYALYLAYREPRVPWYARIFVACVVGYAFSPIDLIPDPIPLLGYLDDLILVPLGIALAIKMIPADVMAEYRERVRSLQRHKPTNWLAAAVIVGIWLLFAMLAVFFAMRATRR